MKKLAALVLSLASASAFATSTVGNLENVPKTPKQRYEIMTEENISDNEII